MQHGKLARLHATDPGLPQHIHSGPFWENLWHDNAHPLILQCAVQLLFLLWLVIEDHDNLFIMAEVVHCLGIGVLIYKLWTKKNAGGENSAKDTFYSSKSHAAAWSLYDVTLMHLLLGTWIVDGDICTDTEWQHRDKWCCCALRRALAAVAGAHSPVPGSQALLQVCTWRTAGWHTLSHGIP